MLFRLWCEWDIGHENLVFRTKQDALDFAKVGLLACGIEDDFQSILDDHLVGTEDVTIWVREAN
jgi:hypothetical protein